MDQVYNSIARAGDRTVSEAIPGPKLIDSRKLLSKKQTLTSSSSKKKFNSWFEPNVVNHSSPEHPNSRHTLLHEILASR